MTAIHSSKYLKDIGFTKAKNKILLFGIRYLQGRTATKRHGVTRKKAQFG